MTHRIQSGWKNWKGVSGILCDRRISLRVKGKVYKTVLLLLLLYRAAFHCRIIAHSCKTSNDIRCRDLGSEESTREEVGCGGNEDV